MGQILRYLAYLQFLPLLAQLVSFVREAEAKFKAPGSGASKSAWVRDQFTVLVNTARATGLISQAIGASLIAGATAVINIVVAVFNASGGVPAPDAPPVDPPAAAPPSADIYNKNVGYEDESEIPSDDALKAQGFVTGDLVAISAIGIHVWRVTKAIRSGFKELRKIG